MEPLIFVENISTDADRAILSIIQFSLSIKFCFISRLIIFKTQKQVLHDLLNSPKEDK